MMFGLNAGQHGKIHSFTNASVPNTPTLVTVMQPEQSLFIKLSPNYAYV